uniref:Protein TRANSPARENT TESTA 12-like n=1 Tax=Populus alba TaxID=43335 RepID=A0A4U5NA52_POPAL|nr:hypothetical protein D5086_0000279180 [Populus alba]
MEGDRQTQNDHQNQDQHLRSTNSPIASSFTPDPNDIPLFNSVRDFSREFFRESKKLWYLAGPAIFTTLCQYSLALSDYAFGKITSCSLEVWYFMALILFAGYLKNAQLAVAALSISTNIVGWALMIAIGINAAISVRVSNELGAAHPRTAKLSLVVATLASLMIGLVIALILVLGRNLYPDLFTNDAGVKELVKKLTPLLAVCIIINNVQPVLSGVAIGAGWQAAVAYVNIGCYYIFGIPLGLVLGFWRQMGVQGIWIGMLTGTAVQTAVLFWMIGKTNWSTEASAAGERIRKWGGEDDSKNENGEQ